MASRPDWQLIVTTGKSFELSDIDSASANIHVYRWVPQLDVLRRADLLITHGGFGTVKESIVSGVPMIVFPLMRDRDQFACAERVVYHGLGARGNIDDVSVSGIIQMIKSVGADDGYRKRVQAMRDRVVQEEQSDAISKVLDSCFKLAYSVAMS